jgi:hypothetical protein
MSSSSISVAFRHQCFNLDPLVNTERGSESCAFCTSGAMTKFSKDLVNTLLVSHVNLLILQLMESSLCAFLRYILICSNGNSMLTCWPQQKERNSQNSRALLGPLMVSLDNATDNSYEMLSSNHSLGVVKIQMLFWKSSSKI